MIIYNNGVGTVQYAKPISFEFLDKNGIRSMKVFPYTIPNAFQDEAIIKWIDGKWVLPKIAKKRFPIKNHPQYKSLPPDVVAEFLGGVSLKGDGVKVAEEIASVEYSTFDQLITTVEGYARNKSVYKKYVADCKKSSFYSKYI